MSSILSVNSLSKNYGALKAVNQLSLAVEAGNIYGLLGPNGSGKTTTLGMLLGVIRPSGGDFSWFGNGNAAANRLRIGALLETPNFYPYLSAKQNLKVVAGIKKIKRPGQAIEEVLRRVNLWERANSPFSTFSLGMKQRLAIASAMLSNPEVLVLDEPTNGLDPEGIADIRTLIGNIAREGKTIIIASHILDEIEKVCSDVAIMKKGQLLSAGKLRDILGADFSVIVDAQDRQKLRESLGRIRWAHISADVEHGLKLSLDEGHTPEELNKGLFEAGVVLSQLKTEVRTLESIFLETIK